MIGHHLLVVHCTKTRQGDANFLSTGRENKGQAKEEEMKMSPFDAEGDRKSMPGNLKLCTYKSTLNNNILG
jgi:hypothetical protein